MNQEELIRAILAAAGGITSSSLVQAGQSLSNSNTQNNSISANQAINQGQGPIQYPGDGGIPVMDAPQDPQSPKQSSPIFGIRPMDFNTGATDLQFTGENPYATGQGSSQQMQKSRQSSESSPQEEVDLSNISDEDLAKLVKIMGLPFKPPSSIAELDINPHPIFSKYNVGKVAHPALTASQQAMSPGDLMAQQVKDHIDWINNHFQTDPNDPSTRQF